MHLVVSGCDASPSTSYPRLLSTPRAVSGNGSGSSFSFFFLIVSVLKTFASLS